MIEYARDVGPAKLTIAYERFGDPHAPPVLLIMGLGTQLIAWPDGFVNALVEQRFHVIRFDNRDVGESSHLTGAPAPNFSAALAGDFSSVAYTLSDMAADAVGLLDALGIASAHLVGASMGGMIAQTIAIEHPERVRSLTSIMSTTGSRSVGQPHPVTLALFAAPPAVTRAQVIERALTTWKSIGSPAYPNDPTVIADNAGRAFDRAFDPLGVVRHACAVIASGDRTPRLRQLAVPALVIHGVADPVCDISGGRATAAAIPRAELVEIEGMGHDLPRALWPKFTAAIAAVVQRGEARA